MLGVDKVNLYQLLGSARLFPFVLFLTKETLHEILVW